MQDSQLFSFGPVPLEQINYNKYCNFFLILYMCNKDYCTIKKKII
jgi:hypothetical protein